MKSIIVICILLSVFEGYHCVPPKNLKGTSKETRNSPPPGVLIEDLPKQNVQQGGLIKKTPQTRPASNHKRGRRQADITPVPAAAPGSAGQPQIQPSRTRREAQNPPHPSTFTRDVPKQNTQGGSRIALSPSVQNNARGRKQTNIAPIPPPLSGSAGQPQIQPLRTRREAQNQPHAATFNTNVPKQYGQSGPRGTSSPAVQKYGRGRRQADAAFVPSISQPQRERREAQNQPRLTTFGRHVPRQNVQPVRLTKDIPKTRPPIQRYRREAANYENAVTMLDDIPKLFLVDETPLALHVNDVPLLVQN